MTEGPPGRAGANGVEGRRTIKVEVLHVRDCPTVDGARRLLRACLAELDVATEVEDLEGDYPSPTILVNGRDVMGAPPGGVGSCRLDLPTRARILAALRAADGPPPS